MATVLGAFALLAAWGATLWLRAAPIEADVAGRARAALGDAGLDWVRVSVDGRDVELTGLADDAAARRRAVSMVEPVWGVRSVTDAMTLPPPPVPSFRVSVMQLPEPGEKSVAETSATQPTLTATLSGVAASRDTAGDLTELAGLMFPGHVRSQIRAAAPSQRLPDGWQAAIRHAVEISGMLTAGTVSIVDTRFEMVGTADDPGMVRSLMAVPAGFDAAVVLDRTDDGQAPVGSRVDCQARLDSLMAQAPVLFPSAGADLGADGRAVMDLVTATLNECPERQVRIEGHTDSTGEDSANYALSWRRAEAVAKFLEERGVDPARLAVVGFGAALPVAENDTDSGRAANRRTEIRILQ